MIYLAAWTVLPGPAALPQERLLARGVKARRLDGLTLVKAADLADSERLGTKGPAWILFRLSTEHTEHRTQCTTRLFTEQCPLSGTSMIRATLPGHACHPPDLRSPLLPLPRSVAPLRSRTGMGPALRGHARRRLAAITLLGTRT